MSIPPQHRFKLFSTFITSWQSQKSSLSSFLAQKTYLRSHIQIIVEWSIILVVGYLYANATLLDFNATHLQESGEQNESATFPILAEIGLNRYDEIPLWNPYTLTGLPYIEDPLNHFWHPTSTLAVMLWGGIN